MPRSDGVLQGGQRMIPEVGGQGTGGNMLGPNPNFQVSARLYAISKDSTGLSRPFGVASALLR